MDKQVLPQHPQGAVDRTRRAIIDAATAVLAHDSRASLGDVALAAGVGRTTLHRYYPDRATLIRALAQESFEATKAAFTASALDTGTATEGLQRLLQEMIAIGDRFAFLLREPSLADDAEVQAAERRSTQKLKALIERGQADMEFTTALPAAWIAEVLGTLVYGAWLAVEGGVVPRADAARLAAATLLDGIRQAE